MTPEDALSKAIDHVDTLSGPSRGIVGVSLEVKASAVLQFAQFLLHGSAQEAPQAPTATYTYKGVVYDLTKQYADQKGYEWSFTNRWSVEGEPRVTMTGNPDNSDTLPALVDGYGPLTEVK